MAYSFFRACDNLNAASLRLGLASNLPFLSREIYAGLIEPDYYFS